MARTSMGRKKIPMKMIKSEKARQVAFSKHRSSLFKKANELCSMTGVEVAIIVFSPGEKPFSFGHPSVDTIISSFFNRRPMLDSVYQDPCGARLYALYKQYNDLHKRAEAERKRGLELKQMWMGRQKYCWLDTSIDELNLNQVMMYKDFLEELQKKMAEWLEELLAQDSIPRRVVATIRSIDLNITAPAEMEASGHP